MKKILALLFILMGFGAFSQSVVTYQPGSSYIQNNFALGSIGGVDTSFKFRLDGGCEAYGIQVTQTDTIETNDTISVRLYGTFDGGTLYAVGDTITFDSTATAKVDYWTGSIFAFPYGVIKVDSSRVTDGDIRIMLWFQK